MRVEEKFSDVLHDVEAAIVAVYHVNPALMDRQVLGAIDSLLRGYDRQKRNKSGVLPNPSGLTGAVYAEVLQVCERKLGREQISGDKISRQDPPFGSLSVTELLKCLKRLRKSIRLWHKRGGPRGYLEYVNDFLSDVHIADVNPTIR